MIVFDIFLLCVFYSGDQTVALTSLLVVEEDAYPVENALYDLPNFINSFLLLTYPISYSP